MAGTTLFVVDMQRGFGAYEECLDDVKKEIRLARRRGDGIVFVELDPECSGRTIPDLVNAAQKGDYKKVGFCVKSGCDGAKELLAEAKERGFQTKRVRVCGVNRDACVHATLQGLLKRKKVRRVEVGFSATAPGKKEFKKIDPTGKWEKYTYQRYHNMISDGLILKP